MANSDLLTDLRTEILTPASSVRASEGHSSQQDAESKARRRLQQQEEDSGIEEISAESENPPHQFDRMA